jgi:uncharacterized protein (TIGR02246 family)
MRGAKRSVLVADEEAIRRQIDRFIQAYNDGDVQGVMRCYSSDLVKTRQGAPTESRTETEQRLRALMERFTGRLTVVNDELTIAGDTAYARGTLSIVLTPRRGGAPEALQRRFLEIWRKEHGEWLVVRTMDNIP